MAQLGFQPGDSPRQRLQRDAARVQRGAVVVALLLGESIAPDQWLTYGAIWAAIVVLVLEGLRALRRGRG